MADSRVLQPQHWAWWDQTSHWIMAPRSATLPHRQRTAVFCWAWLRARRPFTSWGGNRPLLEGPADLCEAARAASLPRTSQASDWGIDCGQARL